MVSRDVYIDYAQDEMLIWLDCMKSDETLRALAQRTRTQKLHSARIRAGLKHDYVTGDIALQRFLDEYNRAKSPNEHEAALSEYTLSFHAELKLLRPLIESEEFSVPRAIKSTFAPHAYRNRLHSWIGYKKRELEAVIQDVPMAAELLRPAINLIPVYEKRIIDYVYQNIST